MIKLDLLIFGYFKVTVPPAELAIAADVLLKSGFSAAIDPTGEFLIPYKKREDLSRAFDGIVKYEISSPKGIFGFFVNNRLRFGVFLGIIMSIFLVYLSSDIVWDVRIEGADDPEKIVEELSLSGLSVGSRWSRIDKSEVEVDLLIFSDRVGWVNINRRGGVAYVRVGEKLLYPEDEKPLGYANIVAECDCVIEEIRAVSGYAVVKAGDSVKAGEILISGVIPSELGGGFCYASGVVIGRYEDSVSILAKREIIERIPDQRELYGVKINFFGKSLNIFKKHRQADNECDIIEEKAEAALIKRLPISILKTYIQPYDSVGRELSDDELVFLASEMLSEELLLFLSDKEAARLVTRGEFVDGGYRMVCDAVVRSSVAKISEFKVE